MTENDQTEFQDESNKRNYFSMIPNIIFMLCLDPYALSLYMHYKKIAGDHGSCFQTKATIAKETQMSESVIKSKNKILSTPFKELGGKPLIKITHRKDESGNNKPNLVEITDIWPENIKIMSTGFSQNPGGGSQKTQGGSQKTTEQEPLKQKPFVVVGEEGEEGETNTSKEQEPKPPDPVFTESDMYAIALRKKLDYTTEELKYAWSVFQDVKYPISDPMKYIEGIIYNTRLKDQSQANKQMYKRKRQCKKSKTQKKNKTTSTNKSSEFSTSSMASDTSGPSLQELLEEAQLVKPSQKRP